MSFLSKLLAIIGLTKSTKSTEVNSHPNRLPFAGCLTLVDVASDNVPSGARGHRVVLTRKAAEAALPSLLGMAVSFKKGWDGHDARQKCGIIDKAWIEPKLKGNKLLVSGYLFARDFPEFNNFGLISACSSPSLNDLGMSYELANAEVDDLRASVWRLSKVTFTGASILIRDKAAYKETSFSIL